MKHNLRQGFTLVELLVVITVIAILAAVAIPAAATVPRLARNARDTSNLKNIMTSMQTFQAEEKTFPTDRQAFLDRMKYNAAGGSSPRTSNDFFAQLFTEGAADGGSEELFYIEGHPICELAPKPDGIVTDRSGNVSVREILGAGECGYQYVNGLSANSPTTAPLILDAPDTGGDYIPDLRGDKVLVARLNNSVVKADIGDPGSASPSLTSVTLDGGPDMTNTNDAQIYGANNSNIELVDPET